jgi:hypothetical protein
MCQTQVLTDDGQTVSIEQLVTIDKLLEYKDFLYEGWQQLNKIVSNGEVASWEEFMHVALQIVCSNPDLGSVLVMYSKNRKPLAFSLAYDDSVTEHDRSLFIYAFYASSKCISARATGWEYVQMWAKKRGYTKIRAQSRRLNGAAMRWFKRKLGFRPIAIMFEKEID